MVEISISGGTKAFNIYKSGDDDTVQVWNLGAAATISNKTGHGVVEVNLYHHNNIRLYGDINASNQSAGVNAHGVLLQGLNSWVMVGGNSVVTAYTGIGAYGANESVHCYGKITAVSKGIYADGGYFHLLNTGTIKGGTYGVEVSGNAETGGNYDLENTSTGVIWGGATAVWYKTIANQANDFLNQGSITSPVNAFVSGDGNDTLTNSGSISGSVQLGAGNDTLASSGTLSGSVYLGDGNDTFTSSGTTSGAVDLGAGNDTLTSSGTLSGSVYLGAGNDVFDGTGGTVKNGAVYGGDGHDTYIVTQTNIALVENAGAGTDRVNAYVSYTLSDNIETLVLYNAAVTGTGNALANTIVGSNADNTLYGNGGNDSLRGGDGADILYGGAGSDTFIYSSDGFLDTIMDFENGTDRIGMLSALGINSFAEVMTRAVALGNSVLITSDYGELLISSFSQAGVKLADLDVTDFTF